MTLVGMGRMNTSITISCRIIEVAKAQCGLDRNIDNKMFIKFTISVSQTGFH